MWMEQGAFLPFPALHAHSLTFFCHRRMAGYASRRTDWTGSKSWTGKRISASEIRPFVFAPIALTDDAAEAVHDEAIIKGLGTIRLDMHRINYEGTYETTVTYADDSTKKVSLCCAGASLRCSQRKLTSWRIVL